MKLRAALLLLATVVVLILTVRLLRSTTAPPPPAVPSDGGHPELVPYQPGDTDRLAEDEPAGEIDTPAAEPDLAEESQGPTETEESPAPANDLPDGVACYTATLRDSCRECMEGDCVEILEETFGVPTLPTSPTGGLCADLLRCTEQCECQASLNIPCAQTCFEHASPACQEAFGAMFECSAIACPGACP